MIEGFTWNQCWSRGRRAFDLDLKMNEAQLWPEVIVQPSDGFG